MRRLVITALFFVAGGWLLAGAELRQAGASEPTVQVAIDVDVAGNGDNVLGPTESCNATPLQVGDTIDVDVVVRGVPEFVSGYVPGGPSREDEGGIVGFAFNLLFDPDVVHVDEVQAFDGPTILKGGGNAFPFVVLDYDWRDEGTQGPPGASGDLRVDMLDFTRTIEEGDGVLTRITLSAVGTGVSGLQLREEVGEKDVPIIVASESIGYPVVSQGAVLVVDAGDCSPTPPPYPTVTPEPPPPSRTATPVITPNPNTVIDVAIDMVVAGNADNALGPTDDCVDGLQVGDAAEVDITVRGIPEYDPTRLPSGIAGFELDILFDSRIASVEVVQELHGPTILKAGGHANPTVGLDYNAKNGVPLDDPPGTTGDVYVGLFDTSERYEGGDGILTRVVLRAVGEGAGRLELSSLMDYSNLPTVVSGQSLSYRVTTSNSTIVVGGGNCSDPTPAIIGTATPSPPPHFTPTGRATPTRDFPTMTPARTPTPTATPPAPTPTFAPTATVTPAAFPRGGGPSGSSTPAAGPLIVIGATLALAAGFALARRRGRAC